MIFFNSYSKNYFTLYSNGLTCTLWEYAEDFASEKLHQIVRRLQKIELQPFCTLSKNKY